MGEGLTRIARRHGGLTARNSTGEVAWVLKDTERMNKLEIQRRERAGWTWDGVEEGEFLKFSRPIPINKEKP